MSFIEMEGIDDVKEAEIQPEGEYNLVITSVTEGRNKDNNRDMIKCRLEFADYPEAQSILHQIALPNEEDDKDKRKFMLLMLKRFLAVFGVQMEGGGFEVEDLQGATGICKVKVDRPDGFDDDVNQLVLPKLKG